MMRLGIWILAAYSIWLPLGGRAFSCGAGPAEHGGYSEAHFDTPHGRIRLVFPDSLPAGEIFESRMSVPGSLLEDHPLDAQIGYSSAAESGIVPVADGNVLKVRREQTPARLEFRVRLRPSQPAQPVCQTTLPVRLRRKGPAGIGEEVPLVLESKDYLKISRPFSANLAGTRVESAANRLRCGPSGPTGW
jgi:hypothetical protein